MWLLASVLVTGCQSEQLVESYPQPNFNGPNVAAAPIVIPRAAPIAPRVVAKAPTRAPQKYVGSVPREWLIASNVPKRDWYWIVIHHSATPSGSEKDFDREHKEKGWDECGYHFVIGNGTNSGNGQIEVGPRWPKQKYGAHAKTPDNRFNEHGIGICLVGNFDVDRPTAAQMASLAKLVKYLMVTYNIPITRVLRHKDTKPTDCPGDHFNIAAFRRTLQTQLADANRPDLLDDNQPAEPMTAAAELLQETPVQTGP